MSDIDGGAKRRKSISRKASATVDGQSWLWGIGLGLLAVMVYWPTLDNGFIWDDDRHIERIAQIASPAGLMRIWISPSAVAQYYPVVHSTFWAEYHLWGLAPRGYHIVNLALHATAALLVWRVLVRLAVPGAWLAAAIFAVHPVCVESVAWATERKNVLSCAFALGSILAYMRFAPPDTLASPVDASSGDSGRWPYYFLALGLFITALLSKTVTATVPAVLLVIYWWKRGRVTWRNVAALVPFFAVGLALAGVTVWMETTYVGARGEEWTLSPLARLLVAGRALWFYAGKLFWPHPLCFFYPRWEIDMRAWWQYLFPASAVLVLAGLWLARHRLGRGPLAAVLIFAGVLTPALGFFNVYPFRYSFVADHFQYHASIALVALAAAGLTLAGRHFGRRNKWHLPIAGAALLTVLAITAERETHVYKDAQTLYEDVISRNPTSWEAQQNLGSVFYARGDFSHAIEHFRNAVDIRDRLARDNPTIAAYQDHLAANCANLGMALAKAGQPVEAIAAQRKGIEIREKLAGEDATRGDYRNNIAAGYVALAVLAYQLKRPEEASNSIDKAIDIREQLTRDFPDSAEYRAKSGGHIRGSWYARRSRASAAERRPVAGPRPSNPPRVSAPIIPTPRRTGPTWPRIVRSWDSCCAKAANWTPRRPPIARQLSSAMD